MQPVVLDPETRGRTWLAQISAEANARGATTPIDLAAVARAMAKAAATPPPPPGSVA